MTLEEIRSKALEMAEPEFKKFEPIALANTKKVLEAFKECQVSDYHFTGTTGYGYNDVGREKLDEVFAYVFKGEKAIVRPHFVSVLQFLILFLHKRELGVPVLHFQNHFCH